MASSKGVAEPIVENWRPTFEKPRAYRRNMVTREWRVGWQKWRSLLVELAEALLAVSLVRRVEITRLGVSGVKEAVAGKEAAELLLRIFECLDAQWRG